MHQRFCKLCHQLLDSALTDRMYIDAGDVVRVRVEPDEFHDDEPGPPKAHEGVQQAREVRRPPYTITVRASPYLHAPLPAAICWLLSAAAQSRRRILAVRAH